MEEILAYVELIPEFKPVVAGVLKNLKEYSTEYRQISDFVINETINTRSKIYFGFIEKGVSPEHALAMTISVVKDFESVVKDFESAVKSNINTKKESK